MHSNGFVLSVSNSTNQILRESSGKVYLPFDSEYKIFLKNNNDRKALAEIKIDGKSIGEDLILHSYESLNLERFILNGDLTSGKKFKFVPLSDSRVQDPSDSNNGIIEVKFTLEKIKSRIYGPLKIRGDVDISIPPKFRKNNIGYDTGDFPLYVSNYSSQSVNFMQMGEPILCSASMLDQKGATIEGSKSNQSFIYGHIDDLENVSTILVLQILGKTDNYYTITASHTVSNTKKKYCSSCGKSLKYYDKFCSRCGHKQ